MTRRRIGAHLADLCAGIIAIVTFAVTFATVVTPVEAYAADTPPTPKLEKSVQLGDGDGSLMTVTKDGKFAAVRDDDTINFINIDSGEKKQAAYSAGESTFAVTEDQKTLFVADSDAGTLTVYDVSSGKATALSGASVADIHSMRVSKDGRQLALVSDTDSGYHVQIYDINGRKVTVTRDMGDVDDLLVSNDMTTVYTVDGSAPTIEATALKDGTVKYTKAVDESGNWGLNRLSLNAQLDNGILWGSGDQMHFRINPDDGTATPLSQQATRYIAANADKSVITLIQTNKDSSRDIYDGDLRGSSLVTYDVESGKERWRINMSQELVNSYKNNGLWNLSYDGRYLFTFEYSKGDSSSNLSVPLNTLKVYDTKTGAASSMKLPGDIGSSFSVLTDSDSKFIAVTSDDKGGHRLSVFSTGIRMNPIDSFTEGGNPLLIVLIGVVAALVLVLVVLVLELRARKKGRSLFAFLGRRKAVAGVGVPAVPAVTTMGSGAVGPVGAVSTPGVGVPATASATPAVSVLGAGLPLSVTPAAVPVIGAPEVPAPVAPVAPVSVLGAAAPAPSASSVPAPATVPPAPRALAPGPVAAASAPPVAPPLAPVPDPVSPSSVGAAIPAPPAAPASADAQPRFCRHCGNQLSNPNGRFCTKCGKPVA